jgi:hypothetical protein
MQLTILGADDRASGVAAMASAGITDGPCTGRGEHVV